jgi:hypothetical protein
MKPKPTEPTGPIVFPWVQTLLARENQMAVVSLTHQPPSYEDLKMLIAQLNMFGENLFGREKWKEKWPVRRKPRG